MARAPWGHVSRHCLYCGDVGPRVQVLGGWAHKRCIPKEPKQTAAEKKCPDPLKGERCTVCGKTYVCGLSARPRMRGAIMNGNRHSG